MNAAQDRMLDDFLELVIVEENDGRLNVRLDPSVPKFLADTPDLLNAETDRRLEVKTNEADDTATRTKLTGARAVLQQVREHGLDALKSKLAAQGDQLNNLVSLLPMAEGNYPADHLLRHTLMLARGHATMALFKRQGHERTDLAEAAIDALAFSLPKVSEITNEPPIGALWNELGNLYLNRSVGNLIDNQRRAEHAFRIAIERTSESIDRTAWMEAGNNLAILLRNTADRDKRKRLGEAAALLELRLTHSTSDDAIETRATILLNLASVLRRLGAEADSSNRSRALELVNQALAIVDADRDATVFAGAQMGLGQSLLQIPGEDSAANLEDALEAFRLAVSVYEALKDPLNTAKARSNLGNTWRIRPFGDQRTNWQNAVAVYREAMVDLREDTHADLLSEIHNNLGVTLMQSASRRRERDFARAIESLEEAVRLAESIDQTHRLARYLGNLATVLMSRRSLGDPTDLRCAINHYANALELVGPSADHWEWARLRQNFGIATLALSQLGEEDSFGLALDALRDALNVFDRETDPENALSIHCDIGRCAVALGEGSTAIDAWSTALSIKEEVIGSDLGSLRGALAAQRTNGLGPDLALLFAREARLWDAVATLERSKGVAIREALRTDRSIEAKLPENQRQKIENLRAECRVAMRNLENINTNYSFGEALRRAQAARLRLSDELTAIEVIDAAALSPWWFRDIIPVDGAFVQIACSEDLAFAVVVTQETVHFVDCPGISRRLLEDRHRDWIHAYRKFLSETEIGQSLKIGPLLSANATLVSLLDWLWESIMKPIAEKLCEIGLPQNANITLLPQGVFAQLPLHAAMRRESSTAFMDLYVVNYAPSIHLLSARRPAPTDAIGKKRVLGVFNPMKGTQFALPRSEAEERPGFVTSAKAHDIAHVSGGEATVEAVLAAIPGCWHVHFACHGKFDPDAADRSGLQLAENEFLTAQRIANDIDLSGTELITFSACETGMVDLLERPDEFVGLPASALSAGARGVVATFWAATDTSSARIFTSLFDQFYAAETQSAGPMILQKAIHEFRFGDPIVVQRPLDLSHPPVYYRSPNVKLNDLPIIWAPYAWHGA